MQKSLRPLLRPLPLLGLSTSTLLLAAGISTIFSKQSTKLSSTMSQPKSYKTTPYEPRHKSWPYTPNDFARQDPSPDPSFYSSPRFVTHIDDLAIESLRDYYDGALPRQGRILDFCSSWVSHYPPAVEAAAQKGEVHVTGMGMNEAELAANEVLNAGRVCVDLNQTPDLAAAVREAGVGGESLDAATCVVSIDYLTKPVEVLESLREVTKVGGKVHLAISNRCFPTKAVGRWLRVDEEERLMMVGDYLWFAGWRQIEIVEVSDGTVAEDKQQQGGLQGLMGWMGMRGRDPLWVVRAVKE